MELAVSLTLCGVLLRVEILKALFHTSIVDAQELVGRGHHVDTIWLAFRAFLVHELVHRLVYWSTLQDDAHHQKERPAQ